MLILCTHCLSDRPFKSQPLEQKFSLQAEFFPNYRNQPNTSHGAKTSPWEPMSKTMILIVMEMRRAKSIPCWFQGVVSCMAHFWKTYKPTRGMWSVPFCFSISTSNFITGMDSKGDFCCSMTCYWLITKIGKFFNTCNEYFCSVQWLAYELPV